MCYQRFSGRTSEVIDKFITLNMNSKIVFTGYEILKWPYSVNNCDVIHSIFISVGGKKLFRVATK